MRTITIQFTIQTDQPLKTLKDKAHTFITVRNSENYFNPLTIEAQEIKIITIELPKK